MTTRTTRLLDGRTQSDQTWHAKLRQGAGVATLVRRGGGERTRGLPPESQRDLSMRSARRGRAEVRHYAAEQKLNRLVVLTFRDVVSWDEAWAAFARFRRRMDYRLGREPWIATVERHREHGFHVNVLVGRRIAHRQLERLWGHGFVSITGWNGRRQGPRERSRALADYVTKEWRADPVGATPPRRHRYRRAHGFRAVVRRIESQTLGGAVRWLTEAMDASPCYVWSSLSDPRWRGPPTLVMYWP